MKNLDQVLERQRLLIREHGWAVMVIASDGSHPSFAYTVGLSAHSQPEFMTIGLSPETAQYILNKIAKLAMQNALPAARGLVHEVANTPLSLRQDDDGYTMGKLCRFARKWSLEERGVPCGVMQVVFPDEFGKFPWELGSDPRVAALQDPANLALTTAGQTREAESPYRHPRPN